MRRPFRSGAAPRAAGALLLTALAAPAAAQHPAGHHHPEPAPPARGASAVDVAVQVAPLNAAGGRSAVYEHEEFEVRVRLTDRATGEPVLGLNPMAWIDVRPGEGPTGPAMCRQRIGAFVDGMHSIRHGQGYAARPVDDLTAHYLVAMARGPHLVVLDPLNSFGKTRLYTTVLLEGPPEDWLELEGGRLLVVSVPRANKLQVVNTHTWRAERGVELGAAPARLALQEERGLIWASLPGAGAESGIALVDARTLEVLARIPTGAGPHEIAFSADGALAFVSSRAAGTLSVIDVERREKVREVRVGATAVDVAYSAAAGAVYALDEETGRVTVLDAATLEPREPIALAPGTRVFDFPTPAAAGGHGAHGAHGADPAGRSRYAFALNPAARTVEVYDAEAGEVIRTMTFDTAPDQLGFSESFAYVRTGGMTDVVMIPLDDPTRGGTGPHDRFPAGSTAPGGVAERGLGQLIVPGPDMADGVYVVNPAERMVYSFHYMEGMPVPHGGFTTYGFEPRSVRAVSRRMREIAPGEYASTLRLERKGDYDFMIRVPEPLVLECSAFAVQRDPAHVAAGVEIETLDEEAKLRLGENRIRLRFRSAETREPIADIQDARLQVATTSGWMTRVGLRPVGDGVYEADVRVDRPAAYYLAVEIPSRGLEFRESAPLIYRAEPEERADP